MEKITPVRRALLVLALSTSIFGARLAGAADLDFNGGMLSYFAATSSTVNVLTIALAGGTYTIDDPGEAAIVPTAAATALGCTAFDSNTFRCPAAQVTSLLVATGSGDDAVILNGATAPSRIQAGDGDDHVFGGGGDDTFVWNPGDDDDVFDGGTGIDTVEFNASNAAEVISIVADGNGFDLSRNLANVRLEVEHADFLELRTFGGADVVTTTGLVETVQMLIDGADGQTDSVTLDAQGLCANRVNDTFRVIGRQPVHFFDFASASITGRFCGGVVDVIAGVLRYTDEEGLENELRVTRSGLDYVIDDPGEAALTLTADARAAGCILSGTSTARCPQAAIGAFDVATGNGDDQIDIAGVLVAARIAGGAGADVVTGGAGDDTLLWSPGEFNDTLDGGPGFDTLQMSGSDADESFTVSADGAGFDVFRNLGNILLDVSGVERFELWTKGGTDRVSANGLLATEQLIVDGDDAIGTDALTIDAQGLCVTRDGDRFEVEGRRPIDFVRFTTLFVEGAFCRQDLCVDAVPTVGCIVNGVRNQPCVGTSSGDTIVGSKGDDVILAGDGNDRVRSGFGADLVCGGAGDDTIAGGPGDDVLVGGPGRDKLTGAAGADTLIGGDEDDVLSGGTGDDDLDGSAGDDRVRGLGGDDRLRGGAGFDRLDGGPQLDTCDDADQPGPFPRCELAP